MVVLTDKERLIWRELRARATSGNAEAPTPACLRYSELGRLVDPDRTWHYPMSRPPFRGLNDALGHVSQYEYEPNRPLLSALVVTAETDRPGAGFSQFAASLGIDVGDPDMFWREELTRTVRFWSTGDVILSFDERVDALRQRLDALVSQSSKDQAGTASTR